MTLEQLRKNSKLLSGLSDWAFYTIIFFFIFTPFWGMGLLKCVSIAAILGFFAGLLNRFLREYYRFLEHLESKQKTGEKSERQILSESDQPMRAPGQRDPNSSH